jgi:hypothetical protein
MANNEKTDVFVDKIKNFIDKRVEELIIKDRDTDTAKNVILSGYRGLGTNQFMRYGDTSDEVKYVVGGPNTVPPTVQ